MKKTNEIIRGLREDRDLRQVDIAKLIGTTQQHYSRCEKGDSEFPTRVIVTLADFYQISTDYMLGRTESVQGIQAINQILVKGYTAGRLLTDVLSLSESGRKSVIECIELQKLKEKTIHK